MDTQTKVRDDEATMQCYSGAHDACPGCACFCHDRYTTATAARNEAGPDAEEAAAVEKLAGVRFAE